MEEDKEHIVKLLWICLQETRAGEDIVGMYYQMESYYSEWIYVWYKNGARIKISVTDCSALAMIHSVVEAL